MLRESASPSAWVTPGSRPGQGHRCLGTYRLSRGLEDGQMREVQRTGHRQWSGGVRYKQAGTGTLALCFTELPRGASWMLERMELEAAETKESSFFFF